MGRFSFFAVRHSALVRTGGALLAASALVSLWANATAQTDADPGPLHAADLVISVDGRSELIRFRYPVDGRTGSVRNLDLEHDDPEHGWTAAIEIGHKWDRRLEIRAEILRAGNVIASPSMTVASDAESPATMTTTGPGETEVRIEFIPLGPAQEDIDDPDDTGE